MTKGVVMVFALAACAVLATSCGNDDSGPNLLPNTELVSAPEQGSEHSFKLVMSWIGTDSDGEVVAYETAWFDGMVYTGMFDDLDWQETVATEDTFRVAADTCPAVGNICHHSHVFLVRAIDNDRGKDTSPALVGFDATTFTPRSEITFPEMSSGQLTVTLPTCMTIKWEGSDSDGQPVMYRYALKKYWDVPSGKPPVEGDSRWSPWKTDTQVTINMEPNDPEDPWSFYTQAKDDAGAIENVFEDTRNHIVVTIDESLSSHPYVSITCVQGSCTDANTPSLGPPRSSDHPEQMDEPINVPVGTEICFRAAASPGLYAKKVTDIAYLINDDLQPADWDPFWSSTMEPINRCYPAGSQGITVSPNMNYYYVWVKDDYCEFGSKAMAYIVVNGVSP